MTEINDGKMQKYLAKNPYQLGYTPENLTRILWECRKKREELAEFFGVTLKTVHNWCIETDRPNHQDMPLKKWRKFLEWVGV